MFVINIHSFNLCCVNFQKCGEYNDKCSVFFGDLPFIDGQGLFQKLQKTPKKQVSICKIAI